jgi:hypothetical protein
MKKIALTSIGLFAIAVAGCVKVPTAVPDAPEFPLRATVTPDNHCTVEALGQTYTSIGQVRGAVLPDFRGDLDNAGYHAIGCWVANVDGSGADGDLIITFAGNSYQQPFPTGSFKPLLDPLYGGTEKQVTVSFRASTYVSEKLKTVNESTGAVTVESSPTGARTIKVDVTAVKYQI